MAAVRRTNALSRRLNILIAPRRDPSRGSNDFQPTRAFHAIPSATGGIARLACARLREFGKDATVVITS